MPSISVKVEAPEGLPKPSVSVHYHPATADDFDRLVDALGGPLAFKVLTDDYAYALLPDGVVVYVYAPTDEKPPDPPPRPFMQAFAQRITECREFKERLEASTGGES